VTEADWKQQRFLRIIYSWGRSKNPSIKIFTPLSSYLWRTRNRPLSHFPVNTQDGRSSLFQVVKLAMPSCLFVCLWVSFCVYVQKLSHASAYGKEDRENICPQPAQSCFILEWTIWNIFPLCSELQLLGKVVCQAL